MNQPAPHTLGLQIQRRTIRSCQHQMREMVRYEGQRRWYRSIATASAAWQFGKDFVQVGS
jgi:hypothetical protein